MKGLNAKLTLQFCPSAIFTCIFLFLDRQVQAAACDSMTLQMKKFDHLNDGSQSTYTSHSDAASANQEEQSTLVSHNVTS